MDIILRFRKDSSSIDHLDKYFIREWKKAETQYYDAVEFFDGCQKAINQLKSGCKSNFENRKDELSKMLEIAQTTNDSKTIKYCDNELNNLKVKDFPTPLYYYHQDYLGHLYIDQILIIENKLSDARLQVSTVSLKDQHNNPTLSVSDWTIVFYYLDAKGLLGVGNKTDRIKKFIVDNNVINPEGKLTTQGSFKKEYHENENRINLKNDKKPLPPDRLKKILPFLENYKKAIKAAKEDIVHLSIEQEEYE